MKKRYKLIFAILIISVLLCFFNTTVFANAPAPADSLTFELINLPENAVYADILIKIDKDDPQYVDFQPNDFVKAPEDCSALVDYSHNGYCSFTFHYRDAKSEFKIYNSDEWPDYYSIIFCRGSEYREYLTQYEDLLNNYSDIRLVLMDEDFNIISVSEEAQLPKVSPFIRFSGHVEYDGNENCINIDTDINPYFFLGILYVFPSVFLIFFSVGCELIVAVCFRLWGRKIPTVLIVNFSTQLIMRLAYFLLPFTYLVETIILEVLVYSSEFFVYRKTMKDVKTAKIAVYTVVANTLSLVFGIFFQNLFGL